MTLLTQSQWLQTFADAGLNYSEAAEAAGMSRQAFRQMAHKAGVALADGRGGVREKVADIRRDLFREMIANGKTNREIAMKTGATLNAVTCFIYTNNLRDNQQPPVETTWLTRRKVQ